MPVRSCLLYLMLTRLQGSRRRLSAQVAANFVLLGHAMGWKSSMWFHRLAGSVRHAFQFCLYRLRHLCYRLRFQLCLCRWQLMYRTRSALADHGMLTVEQFPFEFQLRSCRSCVILSYMSRFVMSTFQWAAETWEMLRPKHCILDMSKVVQQFQRQQIAPEFQHATFLWLIQGLCHMLVRAICDVHLSTIWLVWNSWHRHQVSLHIGAVCVFFCVCGGLEQHWLMPYDNTDTSFGGSTCVPGLSCKQP